MTTKIQAIARYLDNLEYYRVAVMGEGLPKIHTQEVRAASPDAALKEVVDSLPDIKLTQFGVLHLDDIPQNRRVA